MIKHWILLYLWTEPAAVWPPAYGGRAEQYEGRPGLQGDGDAEVRAYRLRTGRGWVTFYLFFIFSSLASH